MTRERQQFPAVFLDKDGTLIEDVPYNVDPRKIHLSLGAAQGCQRLAEAGYALVVVSNQSGIARGMFAEEALQAVEQRIRELLADYQVPLAGFFYCPHHPTAKIEGYRGPCTCRKPEPGMILRAAEDLALDLTRSWMIGDILDDVEAGHRAGCRTVLLDNGHEIEWHWNPNRRPLFVAPDIAAAARFILEVNLHRHHELEALA